MQPFLFSSHQTRDVSRNTYTESTGASRQAATMRDIRIVQANGAHGSWLRANPPALVEGRARTSPAGLSTSSAKSSNQTGYSREFERSAGRPGRMPRARDWRETAGAGRRRERGRDRGRDRGGGLRRAPRRVGAGRWLRSQRPAPWGCGGRVGPAPGARGRRRVRPSTCRLPKLIEASFMH